MERYNDKEIARPKPRCRSAAKIFLSLYRSILSIVDLVEENMTCCCFVNFAITSTVYRNKFKI